MSETTRDVAADRQRQSNQNLQDSDGDGGTASTDGDPSENVRGGFEDSDVDPIVVEPVVEKKRKRKKILYIGAIALLVLIIAGIAYWLYARRFESTDNAFVQADITQVSPKVAAYVKKIYVDNNQYVHKGDLLVELDPADLQVKLQQAQAQLESARSQRDVARANANLTSRTTAASKQTAQSNLQSARQNVEQQRLASGARQAQISQAQAAANTAEANLRQMQAQVPGARANVQLAQVEYNRRTVLFNRGDISRQNLDQAQNALQNAQSQLNAAEQAVNAAQSRVNEAEANVRNAQETFRQSVAQVGLTEAQVGESRGRLEDANAAPERVDVSQTQVGTAEAAIQVAEAAVAQAQLDLSYTKIYAPEDGKITRKTIEEGQLVQVGTPLMAISQSDDIWVVANFKETQLEHMQPGQRVNIEVDAFPNEDFRGKVESIQAGTGSEFSLLPAENASGNYVKVVQRVPVKIVFDDPPDKLQKLVPGMSVEPTVKVR
ncbi:MAG TPA: HlyD family secretion protein [Pyrinomonadaceae bacterium]|nr:HlyD family secretion protein [Pyrinomonadaceae bacterium]